MLSKVIHAFLLCFISNSALATLYHYIHLDNAIVLSNGNIQQGSKLYAYKNDGSGSESPLIYEEPSMFNGPFVTTSNGSKVVVLYSSESEGGKDRSEITVSRAVRHGEYYHIGFELYIPKDDRLYPLQDNWFLITQLHQNDTGRSPALSINLQGNELLVIGRNDEDRYEILFRKNISSLFNQWFNIIMRFKLEDQGEVAFWVNEVPIESEADDDNIANHYLKYNCNECPDLSALKFGVYRGEHDGSFFIMFDNYRFGDYYSEVKSW